MAEPPASGPNATIKSGGEDAKPLPDLPQGELQVAALGLAPVQENAANEQHQANWGYDKYAEWLNCSRGFLLFRQFRKLNVRVLLAMQDEISELEEDLEKQDKAIGDIWERRTEDYGDSFRIVDTESNTEMERHRLMWEIQGKLKQYNEHWASYQAVADREWADEQDVQSVNRWHSSYKDYIDEDELKYLQQRNDLTYLLPLTRPPILLGLFSKLFKQTSPGMDKNTVLRNKKRARRVFGIISLPFGLFMLIGPLWILNILPDTKAKLGGVTGFVLVLAGYLRLATPATAELIWGTTAA
ncbi:hypothetical protein OQA88_1139 [Cercophora sp. LCS_1]